MCDADGVPAFIGGASVGVNDDCEQNVEQNKNLRFESVVKVA